MLRFKGVLFKHLQSVRPAIVGNDDSLGHTLLLAREETEGIFQAKELGAPILYLVMPVSVILITSVGLNSRRSGPQNGVVLQQFVHEIHALCGTRASAGFRCPSLYAS